MENKNPLNKGLGQSLFRSARLVFMSPPPGKVEKGPKAEKPSKVSAFLAAIDTLTGSEHSKDLPKDHPLGDSALMLEGILKDVDPTKVMSVDKKDGVLTIEFTNPKGIIEEKKFEGLEYAVLFWPEVRSQITHVLGAGYPEGKKLDLVIKAAFEDEDSAAAITAFLERMVKGHGKISVAEKAIIEKFKGAAAPATTAKLGALKPAVEKGGKEMKETTEQLANLKKEFPKFPKKPTLDLSEFRKQVHAGGVKDKLYIDKLALNVARERNNGIDAKQWTLTSQAEVHKVHGEFDKLGLLDHPNKLFFNQCFYIVNNAFSNATNPHLASHKTWFANPDKYRTDILTLAPSGAFNPTDFFRAYDEIMIAKGIVLEQDRHQTGALGKQESLGRDTIANKVHDALKSNFDAFKTAIRTKDYATAGLYAVGIWAIYRSLKESGMFGKEGSGMKYLAYGLAAYCGLKFAENAGYDLLKMAGFRDPNFEVKGTPMEAFYNTLRGCEKKEDRELAKEVDWQIVVRVSEVNLLDLQKWREKSNKDGVQFISPHLMPDIFPGLADQLYKIAAMMEVVYDNTLRIDENPNNPYKDWEYKVAITKGQRDLGKVRHLANAAADSSPLSPDRKLKSSEVKKRLQDDLFDGFEYAGVTVEGQPNKFGHYLGVVKGFPVVFVPDGSKGYRVYLANNYSGTSNAGSKYMPGVMVPYDATTGNPAQMIIDEVDARMDKLLGPVKDVNGKKLASLRYINGNWECDVTIKGVAAFGLPKTLPKEATVYPFKDGKGVSVMLTDGSGVRINLDELASQQYPIGMALIPHFISQKEFHAFKVFNNARTLRITNVDSTKTPPIFDVSLANGIDSFSIKYENGKFDFADRVGTVSKSETDLLKNPAFADKYIESLGKDEHFELEQTIASLALLMEESAPESFIKYFFEAISNETRKSPLDGWNFDVASGSVKENFAVMVLDVAKYESYQRLRRGIQNCSSIAAVDAARIDTLSDFKAKLVGIQQFLETENLKHADDGWEANEFMTLIVDQLRSSSTYSATYSEYKTEMEYMAYKSAPGILKKSDFSKHSHEVVSKIVGAFTYYTSYLDGEKHTYPAVAAAAPYGALAAGTKSMYLDGLVYPPEASRTVASGSFGAGKDYMDPGLRGHYILNYMEYVKRKIGNKLPQIKDPSIIPSGAARKFWGIMDFDKWCDSSEASYFPLDPLDKKPAFKHDKTKHKTGQHTEFDEYTMREYNKAITVLKSQFSDIISGAEIDLYLHRHYDSSPGNPIIDPATGLFDGANVGLYVPFPYKASTYDPVTGAVTHNYNLDSSGNLEYRSHLWDLTDAMYGASAGASFQRSKQVTEVQKGVDNLIFKILTEQNKFGDPRFFQRIPGLSDRIIKYFPRAAAALGISP